MIVNIASNELRAAFSCQAVTLSAGFCAAVRKLSTSFGWLVLSDKAADIFMMMMVMMKYTVNM